MEHNTMTEIEQLEQLVHSPEPTTRKHPASLGKLNRTTAKAQAAISVMGHEPKNFKRDYVNGVATYVCPHCAAGVVVVTQEGRGKSTVEGQALVLRCTAVNS